MNTRQPNHTLHPIHQTPQEIGTPQSSAQKCFALRRSHLCGAALSAFLLFSLFYPLPSLSAAPPPELTVLRQQYEKTQAERVTAPHEAALTALQAKYAGALDNTITEAKKAGRLDDVLALQAEQKRVTAGLTVPEVDEADAPEALKKLRTILRDQISLLNETRRQNLNAILPAYQAKLQTLEVTLTQGDRIEEAKTVKDYRLALNSDVPAAPAPSLAVPPAASVPVAEVRGGVLKGLGQFMFGNLPVDLSNAEGVSDFVEIKVSQMGWIARRSNGEVRYQIQAHSDMKRGIVNTKKAVRVCATEGKPLVAIYEDGSAEVLGTKFEGSDALPTDATDIADVDLASGLMVVLHRDGTCSLHGKRQPDIVAGLNLKAPGVVPDVAAMSCARYQFNLLMKDGSVQATADFRDKAPAWAKLPGDFRREVRSLAVGTSGSHFAAITRQGEVIQGNGEKVGKGLKDLVEVKVGGTAMIVKDVLGKWHMAKPGDAEMAKLLATALATPQIIDIDLHNQNNDGKDISRAVLWIEPGS
ncbi:MAG: hypothetical protein Q8M07_11225 [Prosthecobacter sp.]|nr:hypothetical protein [Prosthecobacter sp.]